MSTWDQIAMLIAAALLAFLGYRSVKNNPGLFAKENITASLGTVGWLAIMIIGVIAFCVMVLR